MTVTTKQKTYQGIKWDGEDATLEKIQELFPESEAIDNIIFIPTEKGMITANLNDTIIVTDSMLLALDAEHINELFETVQ